MRTHRLGYYIEVTVVRALVTGGAGFIGHHLVLALLERGDSVVVLDDLSTGSIRRLEDVQGPVSILRGSILSDDDLDATMMGCDVVFHHAAIPSVAQSTTQPALSNAVNVSGTIALMLAAARHHVKRVIFAGSSSVYGAPARLPCHESFTAAPESPYGVSKLAAEHYVRTLGMQHGIATVTLRYFNVFGPGQDPKSEYAAVVPKFIVSVLAGERPTIFGSGDISRDFIYVDNVVSANLLAADDRVRGGITCNVACGTRSSLRDLLVAICDAVGTPVEPILGPARAGDIEHSWADIEAARRLLGYHVAVPFAEGIQRTVDWYRDRSRRA